MGLFSRRKSVSELAEARDFEGLAKAIKKDEEHRAEAVDALVGLGDPAAVSPLVDVMDDLRTSDEAEAAILQVLTRLGSSRVLDPLVAELKRGQTGTVAMLAGLGEDTVLVRLQETLVEDDYENETRANRARELIYKTFLALRTPTALAAWAKGIESGPSRRAALGVAWTHWKGEESVIIRAIFSVTREGGLDDLYKSTEEALEKLADRIRKKEVQGDEAIGTLLELLRHEHPATRALAANTLLLVYSRGLEKEEVKPDPRTADPLAEACSDPEKQVRFRAAAALGHQNDRRATPVLIEMLHGDEMSVNSALSALNTVRDPAAFDRVSELYHQKHSGVAQTMVLTAVYQVLKIKRESGP